MSIVIVFVTIINISAICLENLSLRLHNYDDTRQYEYSSTSFYLELGCNIFFFFVFINRIVAFGLIFGNKTYLKMLMEEYRRLGSYNRVAYIAEIYFSTERNKGGLGGARELWMYNYPQAYEKNVSSYAKRFNVSESLVLAIMRAESHFNSEAYSPVGARGLMQIMPYTATQISRLLGEDGVGDQDLLIPEVNIRLGSRYLSRLQKKFQDQVPLVAAGYNAGPHRVYSWLNTFGTLDMDEFIEHVPFVETRNYMKKVVRNYAIYNALYGNTKDTYVWLTQPVPMRVSAKPSPRENWEIID